MSKKGGFRKQARRQEVRNKEKFQFRKRQIQLREQMSQAKSYHQVKR
jgi:hypothetical protein|tara:strand:+ start:51 stop:191 length:141 start_codon:yes stop_codon:yes gene_type:complete